ncbi:hypothetical protein Tco_1054197 [Tanacetum coccineum]|uniref:60S ribosomal protein L29 n=1 Tax=Tanacetum coccineum TaxID=301880 RepID=A0ABQ5GWR1_9ASTR
MSHKNHHRQHGTDKLKNHKKAVKNEQARTREPEEYKAEARKAKPQSKSAKVGVIMLGVPLAQVGKYIFEFHLCNYLAIMKNLHAREFWAYVHEDMSAGALDEKRG